MIMNCRIIASTLTMFAVALCVACCAFISGPLRKTQRLFR